MRIGFTDKMREILAGMVGHQLISYDFGNEGDSSLIYGNFKLNLDNSVIEVRNEQKPLLFFEEVEDMSSFSCRILSADESFQPMALAKLHRVFVNDLIRSVRLVVDDVVIGDDTVQGSFDMALILILENHQLVFSRGVWFSEAIWVSENNTGKELISEEEVRNSLSNEGKYDVQVNRIQIELKS